ncbi:hypothetical protein F5B18DRAFT_652869 [Nemania serpens]|nr:hypothetical protein F5B18DRAFT_652869 [Nemania serpens]
MPDGGGAAKLRHYMHVLLCARASLVMSGPQAEEANCQLKLLHMRGEGSVWYGFLLVITACALGGVAYNTRKYVRAGLGSPQMQVQVQIPIFSFGTEVSMICLRPCASPRE